MRKLTVAVAQLGLFMAHSAIAQSVSVGAAPQGDSTKVASRIIKYNFPDCKRVSGAVRKSDGSIRAMCDGTDYSVFTVYSAKQGKMVEVALNCTSVKRNLNIDC